MANIIVVFSKKEDGINIRNLLVRNGYTVTAVCTSGSQVLNMLDTLHYGIVVGGYRYADMICSELRDNLPKETAMLVLASSRLWSDNRHEAIEYMDMPIHVRELLTRMEEISYGQDRQRRKERQKPRVRSDGDKELVQKAKLLLMDRKNMEEQEAYRYIQKTAMDSGNSLVDVAHMIFDLYGDKT